MYGLVTRRSSTLVGAFSLIGDASVAREQGLRHRTVIVEYLNLEKATAAYDNAAYAEG